MNRETKMYFARLLFYGLGIYAALFITGAILAHLLLSFLGVGPIKKAAAVLLFAIAGLTTLLAHIWNIYCEIRIFRAKKRNIPQPAIGRDKTTK